MVLNTRNWYGDVQIQFYFHKKEKHAVLVNRFVVMMDPFCKLELTLFFLLEHNIFSVETLSII